MARSRAHGGRRRPRHGAVAGRFATTEAELLVLKADAERFAPVATYGVGDSATWAHLAVAPNAVLVKDVRTLALWRVP